MKLEDAIEILGDVARGSWNSHQAAAATVVLDEMEKLTDRRAALLEACDTVDQIALSERDQALDTDDIRSLLEVGTLVDGAAPPLSR